MTAPVNPMRICCIAPKAYPLFNPSVSTVFGGAELDLYLLATELARDSDFAVSFITADYGQPPEEWRQGVRILKSLTFRESSARGAWKLWQAMKRADADLYLQEAVSAGTLLTAWFCQRHHRAFVYRTASQRECNGDYRRDHPLLGRGFRWALRKAAAVVVQNETDRTNLERTTGIASRVIRNGQPMPPLPSESREYVLWMGRSDPVKRPELFLRLAESFPAERFVMVCSRATGDNQYEALAQRAAGLSNLEFCRGVPYSDSARYFSRAKCLVNTSDSEGFPNAFVQAGMSGTPILSLGVDPDGILGIDRCGVCGGGDWTRFVEGFQRLLDPDQRKQYGARARSYVEHHHDLSVIVPKYKAMFRELRASVPCNF